MNQELSLLSILKLALKHLEAAGTQPGPDSQDVRPALREQIKAWESLEKDEDLSIVDWVERIYLERKGIFVLGWASGQNVRAILQKNGFGRLSQEVSNKTLIGLMAQNSDYYEWTKAVREIAAKIEEETAWDAVEEAGLDWAETTGT